MQLKITPHKKFNISDKFSSKVETIRSLFSKLSFNGYYMDGREKFLLDLSVPNRVTFREDVGLILFTYLLTVHSHKETYLTSNREYCVILSDISENCWIVKDCKYSIKKRALKKILHRLTYNIEHDMCQFLI